MFCDSFPCSSRASQKCPRGKNCCAGELLKMFVLLSVPFFVRVATADREETAARPHHHNGHPLYPTVGWYVALIKDHTKSFKEKLRTLDTFGADAEKKSRDWGE